jgi:hypothetical protein
LARLALGECGDVFGQPIDVDDMGIEVVSKSFFELAVALMVGIGDGFEELGIAPGTADVLGRAAAFGFGEAWVKDAGLGIDQAFDLPAVGRAICGEFMGTSLRRQSASRWTVVRPGASHRPRWA